MVERHVQLACHLPREHHLAIGTCMHEFVGVGGVFNAAVAGTVGLFGVRNGSETGASTGGRNPGMASVSKGFAGCDASESQGAGDGLAARVRMLFIG